MEETRDIPAEELSALRNPATRRGAFDRLVGAYLRPLYWHARRLVVVHEDADRTLVRFQQAILELPLKQRLVFNLRYYDRMPYGEIARVLGQREETLKVNYHHAVQKLKEKLTREL